MSIQNHPISIALFDGSSVQIHRAPGDFDQLSLGRSKYEFDALLAKDTSHPGLTILSAVSALEVAVKEVRACQLVE